MSPNSVRPKEQDLITFSAMKILTSSSFSELLGARTIYAIGTSPALTSGNLKKRETISNLIPMLLLAKKHIQFPGYLRNDDNIHNFRMRK